MKIQMSRKKLAVVLKQLKAITKNSNKHIPVLRSVLLSATGDKVSITATDLDVALTIRTESSWTQGFNWCLDLVELETALKVFKATETLITITDGAADVDGVPVSSYDPVSYGDVDEDFGNKHVANHKVSEKMRGYLQLVRPAVSNHVSRFTLNCALIDGCNVIATDGHRLNIVRGELPAAPSMLRCMVPTKAIELLKNLRDFEWIQECQNCSIDAKTGERRASGEVYGWRINGSGYTLRFRQLMGSFPDYQRAIPTQDVAKTWECEAKPLVEVLKRARVLAVDYAKSVLLTLNGSLAIHSGESKKIEVGRIPARNLADAEVVAIHSFNADYLLDALNLFTGTGTVTISAGTDSGRPVVISSPNAELECVIMPMRA